ncbi:MAG: ABC transporter ATP-binding protein, partial [Lachnospiraceae bacterium]|nr:ABC transporter ATP-binding protein [Lachnospiraceae bacterium]
MNVFRRLRQLLNKKQKRTVGLLIVLIFISALLETLGVSVIVPLVSAVVSPETFLENENVTLVFSQLGIEQPDADAFIRILLVITMVVFAVKNAYLLFLYYVQARFVTKTEASTSVRLFQEYLNRPYEFYLNADINAMFQTINKDIPHVFELLQEVMKLLTEIAVSVCLCILLLVVDTKMTLSIAALLLVMLLFMVFVLKPKLGNLGQGRLKQQVLTMKWMQQGIFGIKDVKVAAKEKYFLRNFSDAYHKLAAVTGRYTVFNNTPRLVIETVCIVGLLGYMLVCVMNGADMRNLVTPLTAFAMAAVRLMPSVNRISTHLSTIAYYEPSLNFVCDNLNIAQLKDADLTEQSGRMELEDEIDLKAITYSYPETERKIFDTADMIIPVGKSVGVIGSSGAGKTTIIDVLLGLLEPQEGQVCCDGKDIKENYAAWLHNIGYIAQNIYMLDNTIRANVAFGVEEDAVSEERIWEVLKEAQMEEYVRSLPEGLDTVIGDRGVRL